MNAKWLIACTIMIHLASFSQVLDETFGNAGIVATPIGIDFGYVTSLAKQTDDKILACGKYEIDNINRFAIVRYEANGSVDSLFGTNGMVLFDIIISNELFDFTHVKIQNDGKILIGANHKLVIDSKEIKLIRLNTDGSLDTGFGINGMVTIGSADRSHEVNDIEIQSDDKILLVGKNDRGAEKDNFEIVRLNTDGSLDSTFGNNGIVIMNLGFNTTATYSIDNATSLKILPDGKMIIAGSSDDTTVIEQSNFALVKLNSDGNLDTSFGNNGKVITDFGYDEGIGSMAITADDHILVCGSVGINQNQNFKVGLARYDMNGNLDLDFGADGKVLTQVSDLMLFDFPGDMVLQADGKILVTGTVQNATYDNLLVRYNADGSLDNTFDADGIFYSDFNGGFEIGFALLLLSDQRFIVGGTSTSLGSGNFTLSKYNYDTLSLSNFGNNAFTIYPNPTQKNIHIIAQNNQSIDRVMIIDSLGKTALEASGDRKQIDVSVLAQGTYFIQIQSQGKTTTQKFIKQ